MNAEARTLGMHYTLYSDPSGFDPSTVSTADSAAKGCLAFFTDVTVGGRELTAVGVVLGQGQGSDTPVLLAAAGEAATQLVDSVGPPPLLAPGRASAQN